MQPKPQTTKRSFGGAPLGRWFGIEIVAHWSLIIIFGLVVLNLGGGAFPSWHPTWSPALCWVVAFAAAILFFFSVLLHELAHALVARRFKLNVPRITLFMFGGVSQLEQEPQSPKSELWIAAAGPATSLIIGAAAIAAGSMLLGPLPVDSSEAATQMFRDASPLATLLLWLGPINVMLGLFNMVPGFPLDGGRVLRSILWWKTRDLERATRLASATGQVVAMLMIGTGIASAFGLRVPFVGQGFASGIWLALIGWFLYNAARASYEQLLIKRELGDLPVSAVMRSATHSVPPDLTIDALVRERVPETDQAMFPVIEDGAWLGIVKLDAIRALPRDRWTQTAVREVMEPASSVATVAPNDQVTDALRELAKREADSVPVVDHGKLLGLLQQKDILRWIGLRLGGPSRAGQG